MCPLEIITDGKLFLRSVAQCTLFLYEKIRTFLENAGRADREFTTLGGRKPILRVVGAGITERDLLVAVAPKFPELTRTEFVGALQDATAAAERLVTRRH